MKINLLPQKTNRFGFVLAALAFAVLPVTASPEVLSQTQGPTITIAGLPTSLRITNGSTFVLRANAFDNDGIRRIEIYANDARVSVCAATTCEYSRVYWTNRLPERTVKFFVRAIDNKGYISQSEPLSLLIIDGQPATQAAWSVDTTPSADKKLTASGAVTWNVRIPDASGLDRIDIWVNGSIANTCSAESCSIDLKGSDYPAPMEIFVNADIVSKDKTETWTTGTRIKREEVLAPVVATPVSSASLRTNVGDVVDRGTQITATATVKDSLDGLNRIDMYLNGELKRSCSFGNAVSAVDCTLSVDTETVTDGSRLVFSSRGVDWNGNDIWSNEKLVQVGSQTSIASGNGSAMAYVNGSADRAVVKTGEWVTFNANGWSPSGSERITILVNDKQAVDCPSQLCTTKIKADGGPIRFTARLVDGQRNELWIQPQTVAIAQ